MSLLLEKSSFSWIIVSLIAWSTHSLDISHRSFKNSVDLRYKYDTVRPKPQLSCSGNKPNLLQTEQDEFRAPDDPSFKVYREMYSRRKILFEEDELGGVVYEELNGQPNFRLLNSISTLHFDGWNATHVMPYYDIPPINHHTSPHVLLWTKPPADRFPLKCINEITLEEGGKLYPIANWFPGNFGHYLHDTVPIVLWIAEFRLQSGDRIAMADHPLHRIALKYIYPELEKRIVWLETGKVNCLKEGSLVSAQSAIPDTNGKMHRRPREPSTVMHLRNPALFQNYALTLVEQHPVTSKQGSPPKLIIFYRRASSRTEHGRLMEPDNENALISTIETMMKKNNRKEELYIFNGEDSNKKPLTFEQQFDIFRRAVLVIGPHGSGLANILWLAPSLTDCSSSPMVLEIIGDSHTINTGVQDGGSGRSHFSLTGGMPWVRYHHMFLAHNSTGKGAGLFVNRNTFQKVLTQIFDQLPPS